MQILATFIREHKQRIVDEWLATAARLPSAHALPLPVIRDHVPEILDKLAEAIEREDTSALSLQGLPNLHAALRAREGYDLRQVVSEYRTLRRVILEVFAAHGRISDESRPRLKPLRVLNSALDSAINDAVDRQRGCGIGERGNRVLSSSAAARTRDVGTLAAGAAIRFSVRRRPRRTPL